MTPARKSRASGSSMEMRHAVGRGSHAGHHDPALGVVLVSELLDRALTAGADGAHGRVPAEVRHVEPQRQAAWSRFWPSRTSYSRSSMTNRRHAISRGTAARERAARNRRGSAPERSGAAPLAPGARAQKVLPGLQATRDAFRVSRDRRACRCPLRSCAECARPSAVHPSRACTSRRTPGRRSARGSRCIATGQVLSSRTIIVPVPRRLPCC